MRTRSSFLMAVFSSRRSRCTFLMFLRPRRHPRISTITDCAFFDRASLPQSIVYFRKRRLRQGDHSAPKLLRGANLNVVFARKGKSAVPGNAKHGQSRWHGRFVAAPHRHDAGGDKDATAAVDAEGSQLHAMAVDVLEWLRLAAVLIDRIDGKVVLAAQRRFSAALACRKGPIGQVDELAFGVDVDCPRALARRRFWISQSFFDEDRLVEEAGRLLQLIDVKLVLPLDRDEGPGFARMKVEMPRAEAKTFTGRDRGQVFQFAVFEGERLERPRILRFGRAGIIATCHQNDAAVRWRRQNLMRIDAGIEIRGLRNRRADAAVAADAMYGEAAWLVVGCE